MTFGFPSDSKNFCKLLWVSCEVLFLHGYAGQILHNDCISVIVSRFAIVTEDLVICCYQECSARGTAPPLRLLHGALVILVRLQISQFRSLGKWEKTLCLPKSSRLLNMGFKDTSREELAWESPCAGISSSTRFSLNSCSHSGISELARSESVNNGSSRSLLGSFLKLFFDFLLAWSISFRGKVQVHQNHFHQKNFFIIKIYFHQKPLSSKTSFIKKTTFIKNQFHQRPLSSKTTFIKNQFHQKPFSSETIFIRKNETKGWDSQCSPCLCEGVAGRRRVMSAHKHGLCPPFGFQQAFMWSIAGRRCSTWRSVEGRKAGV